MTSSPWMNGVLGVEGLSYVQVVSAFMLLKVVVCIV